jgi:NAD(P)-dependent dehydrogenase (short-subunit alcohol dehydrogenase family)
MSIPVCAIVGAGPGNGAAFAQRFSRGGYRVALIGRRADQLGQLEYRALGARGYVADATDAESLAGAFDRIRRELGSPSVLIYNASTRDFAGFDQTRPEDLEAAWRVNTLGCLLAIRQVAPDMRREGRGGIIVIGATASVKGAAGFLAFSSAKAAQRSLAQSLARELGPEGIHLAYVVIDAVVDMPASRSMFPDQPDDFFARPEEIAESVYFLSQQGRSAWTFELDLRPFGERW